MEQELLNQIKTDKGGFNGYVRVLLETGRLDGAAVVGIAKQVTTKGVETLYESQLSTLMKYGILSNDLYVSECGLCCNEIPWDEMLEAAEESGNCSYCQQTVERIMNS